MNQKKRFTKDDRITMKKNTRREGEWEIDLKKCLRKKSQLSIFNKNKNLSSAHFNSNEISLSLKNEFL
jgi:hypothetical protein